METLEIVLLLFGVVVLSAIIDQIVVGLSLPLIQIAVGLGLALMSAHPINVGLDPELFLALFIAPLLFHESRHVDRKALFRNIGDVTSLAIALVILITLGVGFLTNFLVPSIPLAAAFALGATLGPTDAVAVTSLTSTVHLDKRQKTLLTGEALINDASGVVSFNFAVAALVTGTFSLTSASASLLMTFAGGLIIGIIIGLIVVGLLQLVQRLGMDSSTFHVGVEILAPFMAFLAAEHFHVSGILSVVAAGLVIALIPRRPTVDSARWKLASNAVWEMGSFLLNGLVFVLLGTQLPRAFLPSWEGQTSSLTLVVTIVVITVLLVVLRFIWVAGMEVVHIQRIKSRIDHVKVLGSAGSSSSLPLPSMGKTMLKNAIVTTLAGPKGAITLSLMMAFPLSIPGVDPTVRNDLIFIASGVILCTLMLANFIVPVLSPKVEDSQARAHEDEARRKVLREVLEALRHRAESDPTPALSIVFRIYRNRADELSSDARRKAAVEKLNVELFDLEKECLDELRVRGEISSDTHAFCLMTLAKLRRHAPIGPRRRVRASTWRQMIMLMRRLLRRPPTLSEEEIAGAHRAMLERALEHLRVSAASDDRSRARAATLMIEGFELALSTGGERTALIRSMVRSPEAQERLTRQVRELQADAYRMELEVIQTLRENREITAELASSLRDEVYLLQTEFVY
ncbi:MAG: cation:proton antiporter [Actinomycetaceae bacterium]|nr:cation:proton antiporter [Actinomycetaceae bacterium]